MVLTLNPSDRKSGMRAIITGAATGIGASVVELLKARHCHVTALDIVEPENVDEWIPVDMADFTSIDAALSSLKGSYDCLINNAGLPPRPGLDEKILAVNFMGLRHFTQGVLPLMRDSGAIVNTASRAGMAWRENIEQVKSLLALRTPNDLRAFIDTQEIDHIRAYNLSKEAVIVWGLSVTEDLIVRNLRMNSVSPAAVNTAILQDFATAFGDRMSKNVARVGRAGTPTEAAQLIVFLASPESGWIKGNDVTIDGGMSAIAAAQQLGL